MRSQQTSRRHDVNTAATLAVAAVFLFGHLEAAVGQDQDPDDAGTYSMPVAGLFPDDVLAEEFEYRRSVPYDDEDLAIALPVRTDWRWLELRGDPALATARMVPLAACHPPREPSILIEMKFMRLEREVKIEDWVDIFLAHQKMFPVAGQIGTYHERKVVDSVCEYKDENGTLRVARIGFFKTADLIFMTAGSAPKDDYETYAREFALAVTAGTPQRIAEYPFAERMITFENLGGYDFDYPASWNETASDFSEKGIEYIDLYSGRRTEALGLIKVRVFPRQELPDLDVDQVTWTVFGELKAKDPNVAFKAKVTELESSTKLFPGPGKMAVYEIELDGTPTVVYELVLVSDEAIVSIFLVTPSREQLPGAWLVNHRAWVIVGQSIARSR